jgi:glycosyltransferase involved in cell wall biosynthesis
MYAAQNIDKRFPPPFAQYERAAHSRVAAFYPCSKQAASVLRAKGYRGTIDVLPLGYDDTVFTPGVQSIDTKDLRLMLVGRLIPEKGAQDAVRVLARLNAERPTRLAVCGRGPDEAPARRLAASLGVSDRIEFRGWRDPVELAADYRAAHVLLVPSRPTTVAEQFGRVIVEAQASGLIVAGYDCGAIPEVAGDAGIVVALGRVDQLATRLLQLVSDPRAFARLRETGLRDAAARRWPIVAAQQATLYGSVATGMDVTCNLPRSPRRRRQLARDEFGATAWTPGGMRPFALPVLRHGGRVQRALGIAMDAAAEVVAVGR